MWDVCVQTLKLLCQPGTTTDLSNGEPADVAIPIIEVQPEVLSVINNMVATNQPTCSINNVVIQNGLTTNQVTITSAVLFLLRIHVHLYFSRKSSHRDIGHLKYRILKSVVRVYSKNQYLLVL